MLNVFVYDAEQKPEEIIPKGLKYCHNVQAVFPLVDFELTTENFNIIKEIDEGKLLDRLQFESRFNQILNIECLSTGSKAALICNNSDYIVNTIECGHNAICMIWACCNGSIVMRRTLYGYVETLYEKDREIIVNGKHFYTIKDAWGYMENVTEYKPENIYK